jgi:hypothetical protein
MERIVVLARDHEPRRDIGVELQQEPLVRLLMMGVGERPDVQGTWSFRHRGH